jgi:orotate phosphoribosyltransferase, Thermus family
MTREEILTIFRETGVMLEGHFQLTSGRHSDKYMQCARLFQYPDIADRFAKALAGKFENVDLVAGPALGGIIIAYEVSRQMGVRNVFTERENGQMTLRRGFEIPRGARVLVVEDVVTTGGSVKEVMALVKSLNAEVAGVGSIVDRSAGQVDFGVPFAAVLSMEVESWEADRCPLCREGWPLVKPGSRNMNAK